MKLNYTEILREVQSTAETYRGPMMVGDWVLMTILATVNAINEELANPIAVHLEGVPN